MYTSILVPYDGSAHSARALPVAAALAARTGAKVELVTVHDPSAYIPFVPGEVAIPVYDQELVQAHRERDQRALDDALAQLRATGITASGVLLDGTIVEALVEHMAAAGSELVILTTHGRSGFARLRLGSVASALLTRATVPVLLVRGAGSEEPATPPTLPTGALLCALDGSAFAEAIVPHASTFAQATGMQLHLVAVTVPHAVSLAPFGTEALLADPEALEAESHVRDDYLHRIAATCPAGTTVHTITDMSASQGILDAAAEKPCGAIALATHGRSGFRRFVLGSVADEVIRHAHVPVLVVRPPAH
ncbi:MAG: universal stress protein [Gemmatimonas sp.]|nr:universal stress protein [Gemmatimonas sp.]